MSLFVNPNSVYGFRFVCFTLHSTARVILRRAVLQVEETSAYCTVNHWASAGNYQLSNMKRLARHSNRWRQRLEARTLTATPPSPLFQFMEVCRLNVDALSCMIMTDKLNVKASYDTQMQFLQYSQYSKGTIISCKNFPLFNP